MSQLPQSSRHIVSSASICSERRIGELTPQADSSSDSPVYLFLDPVVETSDAFEHSYGKSAEIRK